MSTIKRSKTDAFSVKESVNIVKLAEAAFEQISLDQLTDVVVETPTDGDILVYSSDLMAWENVPQTVGATTLNGLDDVNTIGVTGGMVLMYNSYTSEWNADLVDYPDSLDDLTDVLITTPSNGQVLKYNGSAWVNGTDSGATPGGSDTHVQYNDSGVLGGESTFTYNKTTNTLAVPTVATGMITGPDSVTGVGIAVGADADARSMSLTPGEAAPNFVSGMSVFGMLHTGNTKTVNGQSIAGSGDITVSGGASTAAGLSYDNSTSGLAATDVQGAIDELTMSADPFSIFNKTFLYKKGYGVYLSESAGFMKIDCTGVAGWVSTETGAQTGQFKTSGKWYFEVYINSVYAPNLSPQIGVSGPAFDLGYPGVYAGGGGVGWTIVQDGRKRSNNSIAAYGSAFTAGDVVGVAVDLTGGAGAGKIWFAINNVWQASGDPAAGTNAAYTNLYAMVSPSMAAPNSAATLRISSSSFTYSPPTGFSAWDS